MLFVETHVKVALEKRSQAEGTNSQQLGGYSRIENVGDAPAVVLVQQPQVVIGIVKYHLDGAIFQEHAKFMERAGGEWVDDGAARGCRDLEQIDPIDEAVEACSLRVEREARHASDLVQKSVRVSWRIDVGE